MKLSLTCAFCDHANPVGARFCNACGSPVHLRECPQCEAINSGEAALCHKCGTALTARTQIAREPRDAGKPLSANDAAIDGDADPAVRGRAKGVTSTITAANLPKSAPRSDAKPIPIPATEPDNTAATPPKIDPLPALKECPVCAALNTLSAVTCAACGAALGTHTIPDTLADDSSGRAPKPDAAPDDVLQEPAVLGKVVGSATKPAAAPDDASHPWYPVVLPDDIPSVGDQPVHFIGNGNPSIPSGVSQRHRKGVWVAATALLLIVLPTIVAVGALYTLRPASLEHAIAVVRSAFAVPSRSTSSPIDDSQSVTHGPGVAIDAPGPTAAPAISAPGTMAEPAIGAPGTMAEPAIGAPGPVAVPAVGAPVSGPPAGVATPASPSAPTGTAPATPATPLASTETAPATSANGAAPTNRTEAQPSLPALTEKTSAIPDTGNPAARQTGASDGKAGTPTVSGPRRTSSPSSLAGSKASLSGAASRTRNSARRVTDGRTANRATNPSRVQTVRQPAAPP